MKAKSQWTTALLSLAFSLLLLLPASYAEPTQPAGVVEAQGIALNFTEAQVEVAVHGQHFWVNRSDIKDNQNLRKNKRCQFRVNADEFLKKMGLNPSE